MLQKKNKIAKLKRLMFSFPNCLTKFSSTTWYFLSPFKKSIKSLVSQFYYLTWFSHQMQPKYSLQLSLYCAEKLDCTIIITDSEARYKIYVILPGILKENHKFFFRKPFRFFSYSPVVPSKPHSIKVLKRC